MRETEGHTHTHTQQKEREHTQERRGGRDGETHCLA